MALYFAFSGNKVDCEQVLVIGLDFDILCHLEVLAALKIGRRLVRGMPNQRLQFRVLLLLSYTLETWFGDSHVMSGGESVKPLLVYSACIDDWGLLKKQLR